MLGSILFAAAHANATPATPPATSAQLTLRAAVADAGPKLGLTEPWQKKIFEEEVVPHYSRFIRDYRSTDQGVQADVDLEMIKKYLGFYATRSIRRDDLQMVLFLKFEKDCSKCVQSVSEMRQFMVSRAEHRGFKTVWLAPGEVGDESLSGKALEDRVADVAHDRNAAGAMVVQMKKAPVDIDAAHADEGRFQIQLLTLARGDRELKFASNLEILNSDSFEGAAQRLMTDAMIDFGTRAVLAGDADEDTKDEVLVIVSGIQGFAHSNRVKAALEAGLADARSVDTRRIARGQITFAVHSSRKTDELRAQLSKIEVGGAEGDASARPQRLAVTPVDDRTIQAEVK
jgi:hypothetical protein